MTAEQNPARPDYGLVHSTTVTRLEIAATAELTGQPVERLTMT